MVLQVLLVVVVSTIVSCGLLRALIPSLRERLMDQPNARSSHVQPTPRGGGFSFVLVSCIASALCWAVSASSAYTHFTLISVPLPALPLAFVGFLDDRYNLP